jgi:hypothetical protein
MISDEAKWKIEQVVNTCRGVCEIGTLIHQLWAAYMVLEKELKEKDRELFDMIREGYKRRDREQ